MRQAPPTCNRRLYRLMLALRAEPAAVLALTLTGLPQEGHWDYPITSGPDPRQASAGGLGGVGIAGQEAVPIHDRVGDGRKLAVGAASMGAQHLEGTVLIDRVTLHQNPLRTLD